MTGRPVVLDSNLAALLVVGISDPTLVGRHRRLRGYDPTDFDLLARVLSISDGLIWCPHVLAETSNLIRYLNEPAKTAVTLAFGRIINSGDERGIASGDAVRRFEFQRLGLTDAVLLVLSEAEAVLLTDDLDLHVAALSAGQQSINFSELRDQRPDFQS